MGFSETDLKVWKKNELKPEDTFNFECKMCGDCCRKRCEEIKGWLLDITEIKFAP